ncbi:MAG: universal stress protein [Gammaproteobacteria bacterium]|nr:universal stress protein [Gammaproteobacteria bacterium]
MFKSILVAIDGSDHARKALRIAADIAGLYQAELSIVHVVTGKKLADEVKRMAEVEHLVDTPKPTVSYDATVSAEMSRMLTNSSLHNAIAQIATAVGQRLLDEAGSRLHETNGLEAGKHLERGDPAREILACAKRTNADLVVLGNRGLSDIVGVFMGSVSARVTHAAECTVLTVK